MLAVIFPRITLLFPVEIPEIFQRSSKDITRVIPGILMHFSKNFAFSSFRKFKLQQFRNIEYLFIARYVNRIYTILDIFLLESSSRIE